MDLGITDKKALITGGSKGLGLAAALSLAQEGVVLALCARSQEGLEAAADLIRAETGQEAALIPADLSEAGASARVVALAVKELGRLDILVTNAGGPPAGPFESFGEEDWLAAFRLNCLSALEMIRAALPGMKERKWGRIINLTSLTVKQPLGNLILSNGVRVGLVGASKTISQETAAFGVTVNNVATGWTKTQRVVDLVRAQAAQRGQGEAEVEAAITAEIPLGRMNEPKEVADLVVFLASEPARAITGTTIPVDGGYCSGIM